MSDKKIEDVEDFDEVNIEALKKMEPNYLKVLGLIPEDVEDVDATQEEIFHNFKPHHHK